MGEREAPASFDERPGALAYELTRQGPDRDGRRRRRFGIRVSKAVLRPGASRERMA